MFVLPAFTYFLTPLGAWWSRKHEFEADEFAAKFADARQLADALVKLYRDNATTLTPDRLHSAFYDSHPPALVRIARLQQLRSTDMNAATTLQPMCRRVSSNPSAGASSSRRATARRMPAELFGKRLTLRVRRRSHDPHAVARAAATSRRSSTVAPRRTSFARTDSRGRTEPLAANLSLLAVIVAPEPAPDPYIADRYLAGAALAGISGDGHRQQVGSAERADAAVRRRWSREYDGAGYDVMRLSAHAAPRASTPLQGAL